MFSYIHNNHLHWSNQGRSFTIISFLFIYHISSRHRHLPSFSTFCLQNSDNHSRPVAMGLHGVANANPGQQDASFFPHLGNFL